MARVQNDLHIESKSKAATLSKLSLVQASKPWAFRFHKTGVIYD